MRVSPSGRWYVTFNHARFILLGGSNPASQIQIQQNPAARAGFCYIWSGREESP